MAGFERNVANQKLVVFAFDIVTGLGKTGDAGNLTLYMKELGGSVVQVTDTSATELSSTNAPGYYEFDLANTELDTAYTYFFPKSSTVSPNNVGVTPVRPFFTVPAGFSTAAPVTAASIADAVADESRTGHATPGTFGAVWSALPEATAGTTGGLSLYDNLFSVAEVGSISDATPSTTEISLSTGFSSTNDAYNNSFIVVASGPRRMVSVITDYVGAGRTATLSPALTATPSNGDTVLILGLSI
jgi:hypothetical protein